MRRGTGRLPRAAAVGLAALSVVGVARAQTHDNDAAPPSTQEMAAEIRRYMGLVAEPLAGRDSRRNAVIAPAHGIRTHTDDHLVTLEKLFAHIATERVRGIVEREAIRQCQA